jgi:hypothetical protein
VAEKRDFFENWEVLIGSVVRPEFEKFFFASMDRLKLADPELWMATTWMYRSNSSSKGQFRALLLGSASAAERVLDWFGAQTGIFGQLVDKIGVAWLEDLDGYLDKYSKSQSDDQYKGYNGPKDVDLKVIAGRAQTLVIGGGVAANNHLRAQIMDKIGSVIGAEHIHLPTRKLSTDNSLMIALAGYFKILRNIGNPEAVYENIVADGNWEL